ITAFFVQYNGQLQFKVQLIEVVRHAMDGAFPLDGLMVGKIEYGKVVVLRNHVQPPVAAGGGYMLAESIPLPAGRWLGYRGQQPVSACRLGRNASLLNARCDIPGLFHQGLATPQQFVHAIGNRRITVVQVVNFVVDEYAEMFPLSVEIGYEFHTCLEIGWPKL